MPITAREVPAERACVRTPRTAHPEETSVGTWRQNDCEATGAHTRLSPTHTHSRKGDLGDRGLRGSRGWARGCCGDGTSLTLTTFSMSKFYYMQITCIKKGCAKIKPQTRKTSADPGSEEGPAFRIHKELSVSQPENNSPINKQATDLSKMTRCSLSLGTGKANQPLLLHIH